ncbi:hypothetical protein EV182_003203, partial [Spiromyces aspiralis]
MSDKDSVVAEEIKDHISLAKLDIAASNDNTPTGVFKSSNRAGTTAASQDKPSAEIVEESWGFRVRRGRSCLQFSLVVLASWFLVFLTVFEQI